LSGAFRAEAVTSLTLLYDLREIEHMLEGEPSFVSLVVSSVVDRTAHSLIDALGTNGQGTDLAEVGSMALRVNDLPALARRDPSMRAVYQMPIERAFERQLALLFTSLGLAVIESTPGKRHVDLLCVAATREPVTLVVEAKSTSANEYVFRADAQRALVEHVRGVQQTLRGLPALALVLIVAPAFSKGAAERIGEVGRELGVACHGFPAPLLAEMREEYVGYIPVDVIVEEIARGPRIVDGDVVERIHRIAISDVEGLKQLVALQRDARRR
jgi:hypothetical protein